jgi:hypothetical protein
MRVGDRNRNMGIRAKYDRPNARETDSHAAVTMNDKR